MKNIFKQILVVIITMVISISTMNIIPVNADGTDVEINETNFPDEVFRKYISENFDKGDTKDDKLSQEEINNAKGINIYNTNLSSLEGIQYFTALTKLDCMGTNITSLDVSSNENLEWLRCEGTQIKDLDVGNNKKLKKLYCAGKSDISEQYLTRLNVQGVTDLEVLDCYYNVNLTSLDVSENTNLTDLHCDNTMIEELDLSNNTKLMNLNCSSNTKLKSLDLSHSNNWSNVVLNNTSLAYVNFGDNGSFNLSNYQKSDLIPIELAITKDTFNMVDKFPDIDKTKIIEVKGADYNSNTGVMSNYKTGIPITYTYKCGTTTTSSGVKKDLILEVTLKLKGYIDSSHVAINKENFPDDTFRAYVSDNFDTDKNGGLSEEEIANIKVISLEGKKEIKDLKGIEYFKELTILWCQKTGITKLDVSKNTELTQLFYYDTEISNLNVSNNTKLIKLWCQNTKITELDVRNNNALEELTCQNTEIASLDVNNNTALTLLKCYDTQITKLDVSKNKALKELYCQNTGITELDIRNNTSLTYLSCDNTGITNLNVSNNTVLGELYCWNTGITELNVRNNVALKVLWCHKTAITSLDISKNIVLNRLNCSGTEITGLDVSKNTELIHLNCANTPLAYLNIGNNNKLTVAKSNLRNLNVGITDETFDMTHKFFGIDTSKISSVEGANYTSGVMSNYQKRTAITYTYDCGIANNGSQTLNVTLNLIDPGESSISIIANLDKTYDRIAVSDMPTVNKTGSTGKISYKWEQKKNDTDWENITSAPTDAGTYRVTATVAADISYNSATSIPKEFTILQANSTISITAELNKTYDGTAVNDAPAVNVGGSTGDVYYQWEKKINDENWGTILTVPSEVGEYRVIAIVESDTNYKKASDTKEFTISKADSSISVTADLNKTYDRESVTNTPTVDKNGSQGAVSYQWQKKLNNDTWETIDIAPTDAGTYRVIATVETDEHYLEAKSQPKEFSISQAPNSWTTEPAINDWTYGETANTPNATAKYGTVQYTYSDSKDGTFTSTVPANAGTWYVKASVAETNNYKGLEVVKEFRINKATAPAISLPSGLNGIHDNKLSSVVLPNGWTWADGNQILKVHNSGYKARFEVDDSNYNYTIMDGYNIEDHYVEKTLSIIVSQATNSWIDEPVIHNWTYGETPNIPTASAQYGEVKYTYSNSENGTFTSFIPTNAGTWYVKASIPATDDYTGLNQIVEFKIKQAENSWINDLTIDDWTYGETPNTPIGNAQYGEVKYTYSNSENGIFTSFIPTNAGTWYVKASIAETNNYKGLEAVKKFRINKATAPAISLPSGLNGVYGNKLSTVALPDDWTWVNIDTQLIVDNTGYKARLTVDDSNYDYEGVGGYNATNHYVEKTLSVTVAQATNGWIDEPVINDWTYGETANTPTATAKFGSVSYTYSDKEDGTYTDAVPTNAGIWYVKAMVEETDNYKALTSDVVSFEITKAQAPAIVLPDNLNGVYDAKLSTVDLPTGWTWVDGNQTLKVHNSGYKARLEVDDRNYNYTIMDGYNSEEHYVEKTLSVTVSQAANSWTKEPVINDWTYGENANPPTASAQYGEVKYTYSDSESGTFTSTAPASAGTWYVKASVSATDDYTGLNKVIKFEINKATPDYTIPQDLKTTYGDHLKDVTLPKGFSWNDETLSVGNVGVNIFTASYTPNDNNYKAITNISVNVTVRKAENKQIEALLLDNWTFGNTPSLASVGFKYGQPRLMYSDKINGKYVETVPTNAGTYYVKAVVDGTDNYSGVETTPVVFVIEQRDVEENNQLKIPDMNSHSNLNDLMLKDGEKVLVEGTDYDIKKVQNGNKVTVTIQFKGNYNGTVTKNYIIENSSSHNQGHQQADANKDTDVKTDDTSIIGVWAVFMIISIGFVVCLKKREN